jgi:hypothetical protein
MKRFELLILFLKVWIINYYSSFILQKATIWLKNSNITTVRNKYVDEAAIWFLRTRAVFIHTASSKHLLNVGKLLPDYTEQHPKRQSSSYSPPWEPEISPSINSSSFYDSLLVWTSVCFIPQALSPSFVVQQSRLIFRNIYQEMAAASKSARMPVTLLH